MEWTMIGVIVIWIIVCTIVIVTIKDLLIDQPKFWRQHKQELSDQDRKVEEYLAKLWDVPLTKIQVAIRNFDLMEECPKYEEHGVPYFEGWGRFEFLKWYEQRSTEVNGRAVDTIFSSNLRRLRRIGRQIRSMLLSKK